MDTRRIAIAAAFVLLAGCRMDPNQLLVERELRLQEDEIYRLRNTVRDYQFALAACQQENAGLRRQLGLPQHAPLAARRPDGSRRSNTRLTRHHRSRHSPGSGPCGRCVPQDYLRAGNRRGSRSCAVRAFGCLVGRSGEHIAGHRRQCAGGPDRAARCGHRGL